MNPSQTTFLIPELRNKILQTYFESNRKKRFALAKAHLKSKLDDIREKDATMWIAFMYQINVPMIGIRIFTSKFAAAVQ